VGGVLLVSSHSGNPMAERLEKAGVPVVACGKPLGQSRATHAEAGAPPARRTESGAAVPKPAKQCEGGVKDRDGLARRIFVTY
jgi:hypothetical protein